MLHRTGLLTLEKLRSLAENNEIDTVLSVFPDMYGRLLGKRHTVRYFLEHVAEEGMHVCDYLLACDMEMDPVPGYAFTSWESGYGDMKWMPDMVTLRRAAWLEKTALVLGDLYHEKLDSSVEQAPRRMLQRQCDIAREMGFTVSGGTEIELYLFNETYSSASAKGFQGLKPASEYVEDYQILSGTRDEPTIGAIRNHLEASGIPVESSKGEWGPGQQEINLEFSPVLRQADWNALYKHAAKEIATANGQAVTFMAKWDEKQAGSSMHVHISLWDALGGESSFAGEEEFGSLHSSETYRHFVGGLLKHAAEITAFFAPNVASYKRFQSGSFAPTTIAWSQDNRTAGLRSVGHGKSLRIECRIPGADANPYLVYAAAIAAGLEGIREKIELPPEFSGDIYQSKELPRVPGCLRDAITALEGSEFARRALGSEVVEHYVHFFHTEQRKFDAAVNDWEKARFFERG